MLLIFFCFNPVCLNCLSDFCMSDVAIAYSWFSLQGICIFFFHCILNKDVRTNLKSVFGGKKVPVEESTATHATLLTVSGLRVSTRSLYTVYTAPLMNCISTYYPF